MARPIHLVFILTVFCLAASAQAPRNAPRTARLTPKEIEDVREAAVFPTQRVVLYTQFLEERSRKIKDLTGRPRSGQRVLRMDDVLQDFTALMDEMASNLDQYTDRHSDIRKALKPLSEAAPRWLSILRAVPGEPGFDLSRKEAIESGDELCEQVKRLLSEQDAYFLAHKDETGQERNDDRKDDQQPVQSPTSSPAQPPSPAKPPS